jgi:cell division septation protein DedD
VLHKDTKNRTFSNASDMPHSQETTKTSDTPTKPAKKPRQSRKSKNSDAFHPKEYLILANAFNDRLTQDDLDATNTQSDKLSQEEMKDYKRLMAETEKDFPKASQHNSDSS